MDHSTLPRTMTAVLQTGYGDSDVFTTGEIEVPTPGADEVLVAVRAAAVDRGTWHIMTGLPRPVRLAFGLRRPRRPVPGLDLAGTVVAVGESVTRFSVGDDVVGIGKGSFAPYAVALERKLVPLPAGTSYVEGAALPVSGLTAIHAVDKLALSPGQRVLVLGASGGVGHYAVQIARAAGAEVTALCSAAKADVVRELGATHVLDYATHDLDDAVAAAGGPFDGIIDIAGDRKVRAMRRVLTARGTLVIVGSEGGAWTGGMGRSIGASLRNPFTKQQLVMLVASENHVDLERFTTLVAEGKVRPHVHQVHPLAEVRTAMDDLVAGRVTGKVVLTTPQ